MYCLLSLKLQVNFSLVKKLTDSAVDSLPKVTGGNMVLSPNTSKTLIKAINISKTSKDEFVATQHLLMALFDSRGNISKILKDQGITQKSLEESLNQLQKRRKNNFRFSRRSVQCLRKILQKPQSIGPKRETRSRDR